MNWSIYDFEDLEEGDYWILQQVGSENDGIAGFGTFTCKPYTSASWKKKDGTNLFYADLYFDCIIDRRHTEFLSATELEKVIPEIEWHKGHSGVQVEDVNIVEKLILTLMRNRLAEESFARAFSESEEVRLFFINEDKAYTDGRNIVVDPAFHDIYKDEECIKKLKRHLDGQVWFLLLHGMLLKWFVGV